MANASTTIGAALAAALVACAAQAQQNIPSQRTVPEIYQRTVPLIVAPPMTAPGTITLNRGAASGCDFGSVGARELDALRKVVLDLLANDPAGKRSFIDAELLIDPQCTRRRAEFYMRALARASGAG